MRTALFTNFSVEEFTGWWDGKPKKFKASESVWMPDYLAAHFAKHLANRELLRKGPDGKPIFPEGERYTSPKFPDQVPQFKELFDKAFHSDDGETIGQPKDDIDTLIAVANKNRQVEAATKNPAPSKEQDPNEPQVILPPDDEDDEASFKN
jgi:hypothetical protein